MGLVVFPPLAEVIISLFLFDSSTRTEIDRLHHNDVAHPPPLSIVATGGGIGTTTPKLYRNQENVIGGDGFIHTSTSSSAASAAGGNSQYSMWNLPNGRVQFERPLSFAGMKMQDGELKSDSASSSIVSLWDPLFLGSGGSGAVFSFSTHPQHHDKSSHAESSNLDKQSQTTDQLSSNENNNVAIKVSWKRSRQSVENECNILQSLESIPHVEKCLGRPNPYPYEDGRVMIALSPVMTSATPNGGGITSSLKNVNAGQPQMNAVQNIVETMVGMLSLGIYTLDVQPLMDVETGGVLFIDFTEAMKLSDPLSSLDESALVGFCTETIALIPDSLRPVAVECLMSELDALNNSNGPLPEKIADVVQSIWID